MRFGESFVPNASYESRATGIAAVAPPRIFEAIVSSDIATTAPLRAAPAANAIALLLIALGLAGHLYAAHAIGGSRLAYTHHVLGFLLILVVTGGVLAELGRRFWRSRWSMTLVAIGVVQLLFGVLVAVDPVRAAAGH